MNVKVTWKGATLVLPNIVSVRTFESEWYPLNNNWLELVDEAGISSSFQMDGCSIELELEHV